MKDIVKLDPRVTIVVADHSTLSRVSMGNLIVRFIDVQDILHDMLPPAMNVLGLGRHLFSVETVACKGIYTVITKEAYLGVGQFKIALLKDTDCRTIGHLDLELTRRGNYQREAAFPTGVISGHTMPTGSALASRCLRSGTVETVDPLTTATRRFIATSTSTPGLPALRSTASAHGANLISGGAMGAASAHIVTTSFAASTTTGLPTITSTATLTMPATTVATVRAEQLVPVPRTSERAHHAGRTEHRQNGSQLHLLTDHLSGTPDLHITYSCNINFEIIGFCDASYGIGHLKKARSTPGSMYVLSGGVIHFSTGIQTIAA